jgi:hypothetical protein
MAYPCYHLDPDSDSYIRHSALAVDTYMNTHLNYDLSLDATEWTLLMQPALPFILLDLLFDSQVVLNCALNGALAL